MRRIAVAVFVFSALIAASVPAQPAPSREAIEFGAAPLELAFVPAAGTFTLTVRDTDGKELSSTPVPGLSVDGEAQGGFERRGDLFANDAVTLAIEPVAQRAIALTFTVRDGAVHDLLFRLKSDDETAYYGTGERFNALNQRGYILPMRVDDRYGNKGVGTHKPIPFFMSSRGFGVWLDSYTPSTFDLSGTARFDTDIRLSDSSMRIVLIGGPSLEKMLETFTALTGRPRVPPGWAFGLWKSRDVHRSREEVLEDVEKLRQHDIPASVLVIDSPWETGYNDFNVNRLQFEKPEAMFGRIEELGFHLALWLTPFINSTNVQDMKGILPVSPNFDEARAGGHLAVDAKGEVALSDWWKGRGGLIDFTDAAAKRWWISQLSKTKAYGARAFKCDDGEGNFVPDAVFHDGTPARQMKNRYSILYNEAMQEYVDRELGGDGVLIVRSGYTGVQRTPFAWAGDNRADFSHEEGLPTVVLAAQNSALSAIPMWGSDIAGYAGTPDKELFIRWTQFAVFTPFMQVHMTSNLGPWDFDEEALQIFRKFAKLRVQLFPYLRDAALESSRSGMPVVRPMVLAYPDDSESRRLIYQFMFGPDLLVAPMVQPGTSRTLHLPKGVWYDYWSRERYEGPKNLEVAAPLDRIPLFVRAGAIIPMLPADVDTLVPRHPRMSRGVVAIDERRILQVWPGADSSMKSEGLESTLRGEELLVSSANRLPLEIRIVQRELTDPIVGATVERDEEGETVIRFDGFDGVRKFRLRPQGDGR